MSCSNDWWTTCEVVMSKRRFIKKRPWTLKVCNYKKENTKCLTNLWNYIPYWHLWHMSSQASLGAGRVPASAATPRTSASPAVSPAVPGSRRAGVACRPRVRSPTPPSLHSSAAQHCRGDCSPECLSHNCNVWEWKQLLIKNRSE